LASGLHLNPGGVVRPSRRRASSKPETTMAEPNQVSQAPATPPTIQPNPAPPYPQQQPAAPVSPVITNVPAAPVQYPQQPAAPYPPQPAAAYPPPHAPQFYQPTNEGVEHEVEKAEERGEREGGPPALKLVGHSSLFYWWPAWVTGYVMALVTYLGGHAIEIKPGETELVHSSSGPGVVFFLILFLVILVTSVSVRGLASGMVILGAAFLTILLAYFRLWDPILLFLGGLRIHLNFAAYFWFSTLLFVAWALAFFVFDRMTYWEIKPGQITENFVFGSGSRTFDTEGMSVEKYRGDLFRHWLLGLGAGDIHIVTMGPQREHIDVPNVLFIGSKIRVIQEMVAVKPDEFGHAVVK
jgi:hypothetical protein